MKIFLFVGAALLLGGCSPQMAQGIVALNNQYQYNQAMQRSYMSIQQAPMYNPTTVRCMNLGGVIQCRKY